MNLASFGSERRRENFVMRLGSVLVSLAVLASLVLEAPKAKAVVMTSSAISALAGGFLSACGLTPVVSGMGNSEEVNESVARLIQDYLTAETPEGVTDALQWIGQPSLRVSPMGKLIIPVAVANKLGQFASWVAGKYGTQAGENVVYSNQGITFADGSTYTLTYFLGIDSSNDHFADFRSDYVLGTPIPYGSSDTDYFEIMVTSSCLFQFYKGSSNYYFRTVIDNAAEPWRRSFDSSLSPVSFIVKPSTGDLYLGCIYSSHGGDCFVNFTTSPAISADYAHYLTQDLALDVADTLTIPDALTDGQSIALDVGATGSMAIQDILQGILDAILAGDLAASAEIVDEATEPEDPDDPVVPVVPVIPEGLDKLGAALTSRFPFSIPWDVYNGVTLLAAPPKAPYFEVDFLAPIADRVGGWKGSTKIVLDMSEYEIIGQVCRWTSTIGFCLMLASGTKRLIWTA